MKMYFQRLLVAALVIFSLQHTSSYAQVMNPADPVVEYTGGNLQQPPFGQIADWVKTSRLNWSTDDFKAYIYKGQIFRLKFPTSYQHNVNDGKKYPIFVFFHGLGEAASPDGESFNLYDNEFHLLHGGQRHKDYVVSGKFDGFLLYMQNQFGFYGNVHYDAIAEIIQNFLVPQNKGDIDRVIVNGLSAGGSATWDFTIRHPRLVAGCLPISAAAPYVSNSASTLRFIPIWHFQGGRDRNPLPATSEAVGQAILNAGGSYRYTLYPTLGHGVWNNAWAEPDYLPFLNSLHKANPVPLFTKHEFCVGETPNVTLGLSPGFAEYQWRRNGVVISGATGNTYNVTQYGTYDARFRRTAGGAWSEWSPKPIVVKLKDPTVPPDITTKGLMSKVIPAPDGNNGVTLSQPEGYLTYSWTRVGSSTVLSTADTLRATTAGDYVVKVTEPFGCLSEFSAPFTVINANGPNKPSPASNVVATPISRTQMKLDWVENPAPPYNETNFEIYQSRTAGGPYKLVGITGADATTFTVNGLTEGTRYFYIIRAVNNTGASP
ncbi:MAG TPA: fibronectin type III domain-containing protein, partial [Flavisolibacter sp.]